MDIAITSGASAPSPSARPFDPARWLAAYVELGGGYTVNSLGACLHWPRHISPLQRTKLSEHERQIRANKGHKKAVTEYLTTLCPKEAMPC